MISTIISTIGNFKFQKKNLNWNFRRITYRKGAHFNLECKIKRTGLVESFPFVDGRRPVKHLLGSDETKFEMNRCVDETCIKIDNNAILDISPDSFQDPMVWFKVRMFVPKSQNLGLYYAISERPSILIKLKSTFLGYSWITFSEFQGREHVFGLLVNFLKLQNKIQNTPKIRKAVPQLETSKRDSEALEGLVLILIQDQRSFFEFP